MRPGRKGPRYVADRVSELRPDPASMRPGRKGPRYLDSTFRAPGADRGFNEAGAQRPQISGSARARPPASAGASMRPGRKGPRYAVRNARTRGGRGFNEAGAQRPQICRGLAAGPRSGARRFNEAGAQRPQIFGSSTLALIGMFRLQ